MIRNLTNSHAKSGMRDDSCNKNYVIAVSIADQKNSESFFRLKSSAIIEIILKKISFKMT